MRRRGHDRAVAVAQLGFTRQTNDFQLWMARFDHRMNLFRFLTGSFQSTMQTIGDVEHLTKCQHNLKANRNDSCDRIHSHE